MPLGDLPPRLQLPPAITPTELFWSGDGQPCAHPCTLQGHALLGPREDVPTLPLPASMSMRSLCTLSHTVLRDPEAALSLLTSPTPLSHRAELSQGRGTDRTGPLGQQRHPMVLS